MPEHGAISGLLAEGDPGRLAIVDEHGAGLTYRQLRRLIDTTHQTLTRLGISSQDTVAVALRNRPETAALFLALSSFCRVAPVNPNYTVTEIDFGLRDLGARAVISGSDVPAAASAAMQCGVGLIWLEPADSRVPGLYKLSSELPAAARQMLDRASDETALLLHTSGTTSRPKLVPLTQRNLCLSARGVAQVLRLTAEDRGLAMMPFFHIHGLVAGLLASISAGATVCCAPGFQSTRFFAWLETSQATWYTAVPTMHQAILSRARYNDGALTRHKLRFVRSSSSPLYPAVWEHLESIFGIPVVNAYGMTEAAHQIASVPLSSDARFQGTVGSAVGPQVAISDSRGRLLPSGQVGEVVLRGDQIMPGYLKPDGANEAAFVNGWLRTGDEGTLDAGGVLTLTGRLKEMINSGGEKISPYEVEEVLLAHPSVAQAVAFAAPSRLLGEEVAAAIVIREGCAVTERELLRTAGLRLARCKIPRQILFVDDIPRGVTGKLQRIGMASRLGIARAATRS